MALSLTKHHGAGNDFLVLLDGGGRNAGHLSRLARVLCHRTEGVGADGLVVFSAALQPDADGGFALFNADGSRAEMSGNGMRCMVQAAVDAGLLAAGETLAITTDAGIRHVVAGPETAPGVREIRVGMGAVALAEAPDVPPGFARAARADTGNPHLVLLAGEEALDEVDLLALGTKYADVNVEVIAPSADGIELRVHERGVGITRACGTGSCASAAAARAWGLTGDVVRVHNPGGVLVVELHDDGTASLTGPAVRIAAIVAEDVAT